VVDDPKTAGLADPGSTGRPGGGGMGSGIPGGPREQKKLGTNGGGGGTGGGSGEKACGNFPFQRRKPRGGGGRGGARWNCRCVGGTGGGPPERKNGERKGGGVREGAGPHLCRQKGGGAGKTKFQSSSTGGWAGGSPSVWETDLRLQAKTRGGGGERVKGQNKFREGRGARMGAGGGGGGGGGGGETGGGGKKKKTSKKGLQTA